LKTEVGQKGLRNSKNSKYNRNLKRGQVRTQNKKFSKCKFKYRIFNKKLFVFQFCKSMLPHKEDDVIPAFNEKKIHMAT